MQRFLVIYSDDYGWNTVYERFSEWEQAQSRYLEVSRAHPEWKVELCEVTQIAFSR